MNPEILKILTILYWLGGELRGPNQLTAQKAYDLLWNRLGDIL